MFQRVLDADAGSTGASKRLSERYGIPEAEVQNLLYGKVSAPGATPSAANATGESVMPTSVEKNSRWNPVSILGALLGVVGVLSLVVVIMMLQRNRQPELPTAYHRYMPPEMMQPAAPPEPAQMPSERPMLDSCCMPGGSKYSAAVTPPEPSAEEPASTPKKTTRTARRASKGFQTTNGMEAEEHLAELRAEGNTKAKIHTATKNGVTTYSVR